jgi:hypothetical protein
MPKLKISGARKEESDKSLLKYLRWDLKVGKITINAKRSFTSHHF